MLLPLELFGPDIPSPQINATLEPADLHSALYLSQAKDSMLLKFNMLKEGENMPIGWSKVWGERQGVHF